MTVSGKKDVPPLNPPKNIKPIERLTVQFRMDFFNLFNKAQFRGNAQGFNGVNTNLDTTALVCGTVVCSYTPNPAYGTVVSDKGPREIQYGLKVSF